MVLETKSTVKKETSSRAFRLHIPAEMTTDSRFPFKDGQEVTIHIYSPPESSGRGKSLLVEAVE